MNHTNEVIGVGYIRVSTQKQADEGVSLKVQRREVEKKLSDLGCTEIITFEDEGKSAKTIVGRDGFQDAINSAIKAKAKFFCTYDTSRFARNTEDAVKFLNALRKNGTELICVTTRFEDTPEGRLAFRMLSSIDEYLPGQVILLCSSRIGISRYFVPSEYLSRFRLILISIESL